MHSVEVAIVGGGPAGLSTGLFLLHKAPWLSGRVLLLEKETYPREKICAGAVGARADRALASLGVVVDVPSVPIRGIAFRARDRLNSARSPAGLIGRVVRRSEFDAELMRQARRRGLLVIEGAAVHGMQPIPGGVRLDSTRGVFTAGMVVGADGVGSVIRRSLGLRESRYRAQALEVDTEPSAFDPPRDLLLFDASDRSLAGYYWEFPTVVAQRPLWSRGVYLLKQAGAARSGAALHQLLDRALNRRGLRLADHRQRRFAERGFSPRQALSAPRVLLVGEAAGIDPVTGEGIAQAILYGAAAGEYLAHKLESRDVQFEDWPAAVNRAPIGRELRLRERAVNFFYGTPRPWAERLASTDHALRPALRHFAGEPLAAGNLLLAGAYLLSLRLPRHRR